MRLARRGDDEAYRRLLLVAAAWLRAVVRRGLANAGRSTADSEDVVQEVLLAMHLKRNTWDEAQPIEPWVRAIARHKLVDHLRRRGFHDHLDIDDFAGSLAATTGADAAKPWIRNDCWPACRRVSGGSSRRFRSRATVLPKWQRVSA